MPPKQRFTKEEVIAAALNLARREGIAGVTARGLGAELGVSSRPIFTVFQNMDEAQKETVKAARAVYNEYIKKGLAEKPAFKGVGMQYFRFAKEEPNLFGMLFMNPDSTPVSLSGILSAIDDSSGRILASIQEAYGFTKEISYRLYQTLWIFTHGLACLSATGMSRLTEDEVSGLLTEVFTGMYMKLKNEENLK